MMTAQLVKSFGLLLLLIINAPQADAGLTRIDSVSYTHLTLPTIYSV